MELPFTAYSPFLAQNGKNLANGRINLSASSDNSSLFDAGIPTSKAQIPGQAFDYQRSSEKQFQDDMLRGNWEKNPLSDNFFSSQNVIIIQNLIKKQVYEKSMPKGYVIDDQSVDELKIIMRAMYYQYAKNLPHNIPGQVQELNTRVADWSVPHILSAVDHHMYYIKDIETLPTPMAHPVSLSSAGTRSLPQGPLM
jgi:hypothetical protein